MGCVREIALDSRMSLLRQYGNFSQAYSVARQSGLAHFGDEQGFIAYKQVGGTAMVLADPIAPPQYRDRLIRHFLEEEHDVCFCQTSFTVAKLLSSLGFCVNEIGHDNRLDLAGYDFSGAGKKNLRNARNRMAKLGYHIRECPIAEVDVAAVRAISDAWKRMHAVRNREVSFMSRPIDCREEPDVRWLFASDAGGRLVAFAVFDPVYDHGQIVGYTSQANRHLPSADSLVQHAIKRHAIETFKAEGRKWLFLGLSPLADINDWNFPHDWFIHRGFVFARGNFLFNRYVYPVKKISAHKSQFRPVIYQTFCAFNRPPGLIRILKMLVACDILGRLSPLAYRL
jgi:lysylphosphatidylglycerol synthetase-like protein (DUF2156 family)